jgi:hypothetical protein
LVHFNLRTFNNNICLQESVDTVHILALQLIWTLFLSKLIPVHMARFIQCLFCNPNFCWIGRNEYYFRDVISCTSQTRAHVNFQDLFKSSFISLVDVLRRRWIDIVALYLIFLSVYLVFLNQENGKNKYIKNLNSISILIEGQ